MILSILSLGIVLLAVWLYLVFFRVQTVSDQAPDVTNNIFGTPADSVPVVSSTGPVVATLQLSLRDGTKVEVLDFTTKNQPTTSSAINGFQVAGSNTGEYQILYYPQNSGMLISLFTEPLGAVRLDAERELISVLGLSSQQLCLLTVDVRTTEKVSSVFGGRNLGLSFCPGATPLPQ